MEEVIPNIEFIEIEGRDKGCKVWWKARSTEERKSKVWSGVISMAMKMVFLYLGRQTGRLLFSQF